MRLQLSAIVAHLALESHFPSVALIWGVGLPQAGMLNCQSHCNITQVCISGVCLVGENLLCQSFQYVGQHFWRRGQSSLVPCVFSIPFLEVDLLFQRRRVGCWTPLVRALFRFSQRTCCWVWLSPESVCAEKELESSSLKSDEKLSMNSRMISVSVTNGMTLMVARSLIEEVVLKLTNVPPKSTS